MFDRAIWSGSARTNAGYRRHFAQCSWKSKLPTSRGIRVNGITMRSAEAVRFSVASGETMHYFCARHRVSPASLCKWRKGACEHGQAGLVSRPNSPPRG
jgi:hypothetical protein